MALPRAKALRGISGDELVRSPSSETIRFSLNGGRGSLELEQQTPDREPEATRPDTGAGKPTEGEESDLRSQCFEYRFQIDLLRSERDAAWMQSRKARGQLDALKAELEALRL